MTCSICGKRPSSNDSVARADWQPFCPEHYDQYYSYLQDLQTGHMDDASASQWPTEFAEARLKYLYRVKQRLTQQLNADTKGPDATTASLAILLGEYEAANYVQLSAMNQNVQANEAKQKTNSELQECTKQIAMLEKILGKETTGSPLSSLITSTAQPVELNDPLQIVKIRFAKGEITREQYDEMIKVLRS